jgi:hypothetical protein
MAGEQDYEKAMAALTVLNSKDFAAIDLLIEQFAYQGFDAKKTLAAYFRLDAELKHLDALIVLYLLRGSKPNLESKLPKFSETGQSWLKMHGALLGKPSEPLYLPRLMMAVAPRVALLIASYPQLREQELSEIVENRLDLPLCYAWPNAPCIIPNQAILAAWRAWNGIFSRRINAKPSTGDPNRFSQLGFDGHQWGQKDREDILARFAGSRAQKLMVELIDKRWPPKK